LSIVQRMKMFSFISCLSSYSPVSATKENPSYENFAHILLNIMAACPLSNWRYYARPCTEVLTKKTAKLSQRFYSTVPTIRTFTGYSTDLNNHNTVQTSTQQKSW